MSLRTSLIGGVAALGALAAVPAAAAPVTALDLGTFDLSDVIVGPVGPTVETTITFTDDDGAIVGIADLISFVACSPSCEASGATYTTSIRSRRAWTCRTMRPSATPTGWCRWTA